MIHPCGACQSVPNCSWCAEWNPALQPPPSMSDISDSKKTNVDSHFSSCNAAVLRNSSSRADCTFLTISRSFSTRASLCRSTEAFSTSTSACRPDGHEGWPGCYTLLRVGSILCFLIYTILVCVCVLHTLNLALQCVSLPLQLSFRAGTLQFDASYLQLVRMLQAFNLKK